MNEVQKRRPGARLALLLLAPLLAVGGGAGEAAAQSVGFEVGLAGVQNYSADTPSLGVSLFLPLADRFRASVSYSRWTGCDSGACEDPQSGYGNQGVNVLGLFRLLGGERGVNASVGAGTGWYEMRRVVDAESERYWENALTLSGEIRVPVSYGSSAYLRADTSYPAEDSRPRWGFVRVGVDVGVF